MKKTLAIVGSQWGDEGKGKITNYFANDADYIVRWSGGDNAGHTIVFKGKEFHLSAIPSGIFNPKSVNVIGNGCVLNLKKLVAEMQYLKNNGISCEKLQISNRVHLILPYHLDMDIYQEQNRVNSIGTTKKGIGPAYQDKASRDGIRLCDLYDDELFAAKLKSILLFRNKISKSIYNGKTFSAKAIFDEYKGYFNLIKKYITDTSILLDSAIKANKKVLFEGAQGVMLDLDHGTYPFVTSSNSSAASIPVGTGISMRYINEILGITKAYCTRVGEGPFPSEMDEKLGDYIRQKANEYGVVSKRPRRIGWIDLVLLKHSVRISGFTSLAITLLDVLSSIKEIKLCVAYKLNGKKIDYVPPLISSYLACEPVFITMPGWDEDISKIKSFNDLPVNARNYLKKIAEFLDIEISMVSFGPAKEQTLLLKKIF